MNLKKILYLARGKPCTTIVLVPPKTKIRHIQCIAKKCIHTKMVMKIQIELLNIIHSLPIHCIERASDK